ncbi:MAG: type II toxin-antitoxin system RelE/ParE family toxin [bacterium]|nr:type II toxin-antitoxin system RelE/ParE family toxin [bacterium]MXZ31445.1 type II toxin-antitoxin system RelE/ParE family toxin [Acidimicrobiia bacterium]MYB24947.1 type II toxin-antitoxin system RelE/ParE family toxin [Acidimicrobiia bacterium]MYJ14606.1 type II toxin-antitoxin system RelE/ParE family toxin [Acidimicrobiia bacterium]
MYDLRITPGGARSLDRLPEKIPAAVAETIHGPLAENPQMLSRSLVGALEGLRVARQGDYRIIYEIDEDERLVIVHRVKHRRDVYRRH